MESEPTTPVPVTVNDLMTNAFTWDRSNPVVRDPDSDPDPALAYLAARALHPSAPSSSIAALRLPLPPDQAAAASAELAWAVRRNGGDDAAVQSARVLGATSPARLEPAAAAAGALALAGTEAARPWCGRLSAATTATTASSRVALAQARCGQPTTWPEIPVPQLAVDVEDPAAEAVYDLAFDGADDARDRAVEAARAYLEEVGTGNAHPSDRALAMLSLAAHEAPRGNAQVGLRQIELFAGALPASALPDPFGQVMALKAWRSMGGPPAGVDEVFADVIMPVTGTATVGEAILHLGLGDGLPVGTHIAAGPDEDAITAYGLTAIISGGAACAATAKLRPPLGDLRTAAGQPMTVAPSRTVMLAIGALVEKGCGQPQVASIVSSLVEGQIADTTGASDQPYRLWGELEAACVLDGSLSPQEKARATATADRYLRDVVGQPATRFGVGDVYGATRLNELARGCEGAWWTRG